MKYFYIIIFSGLLASCDNNLGASNYSQIQSPAMNSKNLLADKSGISQILPYTLGGTFDSMSNHPTVTTSCMTVASQANAAIIANPQATLDFSQTQSLQQVMHALGVDVSIQIGWGPFAVHAGYSYANTSQDDSYNLNINYIYQYSGLEKFSPQLVIQGESALTSQAQLALASPTEFRQMCGDNFVTQLDAGASVLFRLTLTFDSSVEKNYFDDQLQQIGGLENVLAIIKQNSLSNIHYSLSADGIQVGGNPQLLNNLFLQYGGTINSDGYATLNCGSGTNISANCVNLVNQVVDYAETLKSQLNSPADYYLSNPVISSYNNIGIYSGAVNPDPAIIQAMESVTSSYSNLVSTNQFIQNYQNALADEGLLSTSLQSDLQQLAILYQNAVAVYLDPANSVMDCYNGFVSSECINIYANLNFQTGQIFNNSQLLSELTYLRTQQYLVRLPISNDINQTVICSIYPLASAANNNYAVNCDGSVSGSLTATPIQVSENAADYSLTVNNLYYNYNGNNFIVTFPQPLQLSGFYSTDYSGVAQVSINGNLLADNYPLTFVKQTI